MSATTKTEGSAGNQSTTAIVASSGLLLRSGWRRSRSTVSAMRPKSGRREASGIDQAHSLSGCERGGPNSLRPLSRQLARVLLKKFPVRGAMALTPLLVEAGVAELGAEEGFVHVVEHHPHVFEVLAEADVERGEIGALIESPLIQVLGDKRLKIARQRVPRAAVRERPVSVPHMARHRQVFLDLVD